MNEAANQLRQLIMGFRTTQLIYVVAKLGVADELAAGPKKAEELGARLGADSQALYRILRALASIGLFAEAPDQAFTLTPMGELLRTEVTGSMSSVALLYGEDWLWQAYGNMLFSAQTGQPAFPHTHGLSFYDFLDTHPAAAALFQSAMTSFSEQETKAILEAYDFSNVNTIVDVGAGHGTLLTALLQVYPRLSGIAFDVPAAAERAERRFAQAGLAPRASFVGGDFFTEVPAGADLYLLKSVLHNWDDAGAKGILQTCRRAAPPGGRLLLIDRVIRLGSGTSEPKLFDVNMLVTVGGRERTEHEHEALLAESGFAVSRVIATSSPLTLIEAIPNSGQQL